LAVVSESGKYGIVDKTGSFRLRPIYKYLAAIPPIDTSVKGSSNVTPSGGARYYYHYYFFFLLLLLLLGLKQKLIMSHALPDWE
jgi:hypothetical protein